VGVVAADGQDAGGAGAEDDLGAGKNFEKMAHQAAGGRPIPGVKGELTAAGLLVGIVPGNLETVEEVTKGLGRMRSVLIEITGNKKVNCHGWTAGAELAGSFPGLGAVVGISSWK